ncbi:hypothetical protein FOBRF1_002356 [Fusarium oxysporum]
MMWFILRSASWQMGHVMMQHAIIAWIDGAARDTRHRRKGRWMYVEIPVDEDRPTGHNKGRIRAASSGDPWSRYLSSGPVALLGLG